jgi:uncharacterized protein YidB (DUF937 family)
MASEAAMMDGRIRLGEQTGLSARSAGFIAATLRHMLSLEHGGLRGFLDRFGRVGHAEAIASWIAQDSENVAPTQADLDAGLPANVAHQLAGFF